MTRPHVGTEARRRRLAARHHLGPEARSPDVVQVARDLVGYHGTDPAGPFLAARARVDDLAIDELERVLYEERSLVRLLGHRRTQFVVPTELVPVLHGAAARDIARRERTRLIGMLEVAGVAGDADGRARWLADVERQTLEALERRGEAAAAELAVDVAAPGSGSRPGPAGCGRAPSGSPPGS
jgi:hypothetical protein